MDFKAGKLVSSSALRRLKLRCLDIVCVAKKIRKFFDNTLGWTISNLKSIVWEFEQLVEVEYAYWVPACVQ